MLPASTLPPGALALVAQLQFQLPTTETNNRNNSDEEEDKGISKIQVPRQRYMWRAGDNEDHEEQQFLLLTSCVDEFWMNEESSAASNGKFDDDEAMDLDSRINGIGRSMDEKEDFGYEAEEIESKNPIPFNYVLDLRNFLPSSPPTNDKKEFQ